MQTLGPLYDMGKTHISEHEAIFFRSSNKDNMHRKRALFPMEEEWWNSEETDRAAADDSGSDINDESLRPPPDKDFETDPVPVLSVFVRLLVIMLLGIGIPWLLNDVASTMNVPILARVCCLIPFVLFLLVLFYNGLSTRRLRVQHSIDRLVIEEFSRFSPPSKERPVSSDERPLSEAAYLEYTVYRSENADEDTSTYKWYIVHGHSNEGEEWKLDVTGLVVSFGNHRRKAEEIADAIGIEFRG